jgi:uncharacterized RDD family membrane protein YckC
VPPPSPYHPPQLRYWDGGQWTEHTAPMQQPSYPQTYAAPGKATTTPDGVPLAGWWQRVGAYLIDSIIVGLVTGVLAFHFYREAWHVIHDYLNQAINDADAGRQSTVDQGQLQRDLVKPLAGAVAIQLVVSFIYYTGFLMWKQATIGKLVLGLRVRLRERPGPMSIGTVALRWLGQFGITILGLIPFVGSITGLYSLLDSLWPLWDDHRQAIHDKFAGTNVVRVR